MLWIDVIKFLKGVSKNYKCHMEKKGRTMTFNVITNENYGVSFSSWSKFISNSELDNMRIRGSQETTTSFQRWTSWTCTDKSACTYLSQLRRVPKFPHAWFKKLVHLYTPTMIGLTIGVKVHLKSIARKVSHMSIIPTLGCLALEFSWDSC
jgi:hypothetical protein